MTSLAVIALLAEFAEIPRVPNVELTLTSFRNGVCDRTTAWDGRNWWRALRTSIGPALLHLALNESTISVRAVGPGASSALRLAPSFAGLSDVPPDRFGHAHDAVARAQRSYGQLRLGASLDPYHELLPAILGQRITAAEAVRQWRDLCELLGSEAPRLEGAPSLKLPPDPERLLATPYWELHRLGIERRRADTLREIARRVRFLDGLVSESNVLKIDPDHVHSLTRSLQLIRGVGVWTAAVAGMAAFGDSDALCVGDFHAKNTVAFALTGQHRGTDEQMCDLLAPYGPHRARVLRWLELDGWVAPKHGPRRRNLSIARF